MPKKEELATPGRAASNRQSIPCPASGASKAGAQSRLGGPRERRKVNVLEIMSVQGLTMSPKLKNCFSALVGELNIEYFLKAESKPQEPEPAEIQIVGEPGCQSDPGIPRVSRLLDGKQHLLENGVVESAFHVPPPDLTAA